MELEIYYNNSEQTKTIKDILKLIDKKKLSFSEAGILIKNLEKKINLSSYENDEITLGMEKLIANKYLKLDKKNLIKFCENKFSTKINKLQIDVTKKIILEIINEIYLTFILEKINNKNIQNFYIHEDCIIESLPPLIFNRYEKLMKELEEEHFIIKKVENDKKNSTNYFYCFQKKLTELF